MQDCTRRFAPPALRELAVEKDNPRARAFYEHCGLRHAGDDGDEHRMRLD